MQFSKHIPLPPYPNDKFILARRICVPRDQPQPGSFLNKREEPGNEVGNISPFNLRRPSTSARSPMLRSSPSSGGQNLVHLSGNVIV